MFINPGLKVCCDANVKHCTGYIGHYVNALASIHVISNIIQGISPSVEMTVCAISRMKTKDDAVVKMSQLICKSRPLNDVNQNNLIFFEND